MRHFLTMLIAFHWMAVFAMLAAVSTLESEHGMLAALRFLGAVPLSDAYSSGGGPLAAGFLSFAFAVASLLFLWTLLTALCWATACFGGQTEEVARRAFGCGVGVFSLLLIGGARAAGVRAFPDQRRRRWRHCLLPISRSLPSAGRCRRFRRPTMPTCAPRSASWRRAPRTARC